MNKQVIALFLSQPYPYLFSLKRDLIIAVILSCIIGSINFLTVDNLSSYSHLLLSKTGISVISAATTFCGILLITQLLPLFFLSPQKRDNWTVGREITLIALLLFTISVINYLTFSYFIPINRENPSFLTGLLNTLGSTLLIGIPPTILIVWVNYTLILRQNLNKVQTYNDTLIARLNLLKKASESQTVQIPTNLSKEIIKLNPENFVLARADGNYVEIYQASKDGEVSRSVYRISIKELVTALDSYAFIHHPHRSFLINLNSIESASGNARNYRLKLKDIPFEVPVSRAKFAAFDQGFSDFTALS